MELFQSFYETNPQVPYFGSSVGKGCCKMSKSRNAKKIGRAKIESDPEYSEKYSAWHEYPVFTNPSHPSWNNLIRLCQGDIWEIQWDMKWEIQWKIHCFYKSFPSLLEQSNQTLPRRDWNAPLQQPPSNPMHQKYFPMKYNEKYSEKYIGKYSEKYNEKYSEKREFRHLKLQITQNTQRTTIRKAEK